ncbi:MAG: hypothetical protein WCA98_10540 [Candidatus Acidiferrales bacterium]
MAHLLVYTPKNTVCYPPAVALVSLRPVAEGEIMHWYAYVAYFFGGAFLVNAVPHFANGVSGRRFPSPFASPPGKGESSPTVNVLWGTFNLAIAYLLVVRVGEFHLHQTSDVLVLGAGGLLMAIQLAGWFGRTYGRH